MIFLLNLLANYVVLQAGGEEITADNHASFMLDFLTAVSTTPEAETATDTETELTA